MPDDQTRVFSETVPDDLGTLDCLVVGGGPAGATAAERLATKGHKVGLLDRAGRIKPCGGAIPPRLVDDFNIPSELLVARARGARIVAPSNAQVDMPIEGGYVGMVDRDVFDEWLRDRAAAAGATRITGRFQKLDRDPDGVAVVVYRAKDKSVRRVRARRIIGADGANSQVARQAIPGQKPAKCVFAYHEVVTTDDKDSTNAAQGQDGYHYDPVRCDIFYRGDLSPDFYSWVFPHGDHASIGTGSAQKGFSLKNAVSKLRDEAGISKWHTVREEGAPIPMEPLKKWDNGRDVVLVGDAAGVVAPASGEGIYYAMACADIAALCVDASLQQNSARPLKEARRMFMKEHGRVFWILGIMQRFWYKNDKRRERFTSMCADPDVQRLTWEAYMQKRLVRRDPMAHVRIFFKDMAHLLGFLKPDHGRDSAQH